MSNTSFPILTTRRIVISKDFDSTTSSSREFTKVKVEFLLKSREETSLSRWFSLVDSEYAQYLKINFMALDDSSASFSQFLQDPNTRYRTLKALPSLGLLRNQPFRYSGNSISVAQVLQNNFFTTTPVSDTSGDYNHDIYGELEIDISRLDLDNTDNLHLIGFIHMDVDTYLLDKGISLNPALPDPIESKGSDMIYDLLLQSGNHGLEVPLFRNVFYVNQSVQTVNLEGQEITRTDLVGYYGPAHYHGEDNPGPSGYVGWMAGYGGQDMGPQLEVRRIRNYKVVSSIYDLEGSDVFGLQPRFDSPDQSTGQGLESYLGSIIDLEELSDHSRRIEELVKASSYSESKVANNFMKVSDVAMNYVSSITSQDQNTGEATNERSHHAIVFGLDYLLLVMGRSNYGGIINFHHSLGNEEIIERFLGSSKILNLEITRERVTNNPYSFNDNDSLTYKVYDADEPRIRLVNTQDDQRLRPLRAGELAYKGHLLPCSSQLASISEVDLVSEEGGEIVSVPGYNRFFCIKDYDLFHNVQTGRYRHNLSLTLVDGIHTVITQILEEVNSSVEEVNRMIIDASQPVIRDRQGLYVQGSYDYNARDFHSSFRSKDFSSVVRRAIAAFSNSTHFFSGVTLDRTVIDQIECAIDPRSTNLETLNHFHSLLNNMSSALEDILRLNGDSSYSEDLKKKGKTYIPASGPSRKTRTIEVLVDCLEVIDAISEGTLMANYSNYQSTDDQENDITPATPNLGFLDYLSRAGGISGRVTDNLIMPSSYSVFSASPYNVENLRIDQQHVEPRFEDRGTNTVEFAFKSSPKVLSSFAKFQSMPALNQSNELVKINSMRSEPNVSSGFGKKPLYDVVRGSFALAGFDIKQVGNLSSAGKIESVLLGSSSKSKEMLKDALEKQSRDNCLELSSNLKSALQAAAINGITRRELIGIVEQNYKDLIGISETIGSVYDNMLPLIGALQSTAGQMMVSRDYSMSSEDLFLGRENNNEIESSNQNQAYIHDSARMMLVAPGLDSREINISSALSWKPQEGQPEKMILVKIEPTKKEDGIVPVNNGYLLRI